VKKLTILVISLMAFWTPQPGPQLEAATCPADFTFFGGSRGGGKSDCLLGRQLRGAELYKGRWNGLMLRRKYKEFQEMRRRIDILIQNGLPAERIGGDQQTNYLRVKNGAQVILAAIDRLERVNDHVGQQYCVAENTPIIMADGSFRPIQNVTSGDMVITLEGPKKVLHRMSPRIDLCVEAITPFGSQVHPIQHPILTASGWQSYASILDAYSITTEEIPRGSSLLPVVSVLSVLYKPPQRQFRSLETSTIRHNSCISSKQDCEIGEHLRSLCLDRQQPPAPQQHSSDYEFLRFFSGGIAYEQLGLGIAADCQSNYFSGLYLHDEQPLGQTRSVLSGTPLQDDVALPFRFSQYMRGVQGSIQEYIPGGVSQYRHPYSGLVREVSEENVFSACLISFYGKAKVYDLTVEDANHYITGDSLLVNKNSEVGIDECTTFPFFTKMVDKLKGSVRSPYGVPCHIFGTGNPGGPGHNEVKEYFKLGTGSGVEPKTIMYHKLEGDFQETRIFIPSFLKDNRILCENDPLYVARLLSIKDPALKKAWIKGDWDVFIGQAFNLTREYHIIKPVPVPDYAPIYMTFDWGFGAPFAIGWWWVDADNRVFRFAEWYGWNGTPNEGLRLEDSLIAEGILEKEKAFGINDRKIIRLAGNDCFNKKPDYRGGGQGPSTAEVFKGKGVELRPSDALRILKIRQFRERLIIPKDSMPMMMIYDTCKEFIRTIPALCADDINPEDIDTQQEDHIYDEACHICMARPLSLVPSDVQNTEHAKRVAATRAKLGNIDQAAWSELDEFRKELDENETE